MAICRLNEKEVVSITWQGFGLVLKLEEGKLIPMDERDTVESLLNDYLRLLRGYAEDYKKMEATNSAALTIIQGIATLQNAENDPSFLEGMRKAKLLMEKKRNEEKELNLFLIEVMDFMSDFGVKVKTSNGSMVEDKDQTTAILDRLKKAM